MKELLQIQHTLKAPKGNFNSFGKYKYRSAEDILEAVKPLLNTNKCSLTISDDVVMMGARFYIKATVTLFNEKGESVTTTAYAREEDEKKGMDASQVTGAASSYARKYALNGMFAIDDTKDADALNTSPAYTQAPKKDLSAVKKTVNSCKTMDELVNVWNNYESLHKDADFKQLFTNKKIQLQTVTDNGTKN